MSETKPGKIIVLITYFGEFPWYFPYFLHSCQFNSDVDFLIFSDAKTSLKLPPNVRQIDMTLADVRQLACAKLSMEVRIDYPYKLCDFKPAYGLIFENYTTGYGFWGQSDIDIIYGNLRSLITDNILRSHDFISARHDYATGCFTISRNSPLMNNFFKRSKDYEYVFTSSEYLGFDELNFKHCELNEGKDLEEVETDIECFTHLVRKGSECGEIRTQFDFIMLEGIPGKIKFDKGRLLYKNQFEAALYHLHWLKKTYMPKPKLHGIPDTYYISPTRIYTRNDQMPS
ncbi:DUF6625 family protein [Puia dinghuensis]|uniref:Uncharacterized protein n=1 Tax=Puia dinghuensis TaxID=1792502 RepID=A0A8J2UG98_9BACT|nr:DUF6625 family protein [Puia dinghuensis]GGB11572.1 hypothetical protein GCM10011511_39010 [Puia dinghuensis]